MAVAKQEIAAGDLLPDRAAGTAERDANPPSTSRAVRTPHVGAIAIVAGGLTGALESLVCYPLEFAKTQLQLNVAASTAAPLSTVTAAPFVRRHGSRWHFASACVHRSPFASCLCRVVQEHGPLGVYRGMAPVLAGSVPKQGARWGTYETLTERLRQSRKTAPPSPTNSGTSGGASQRLTLLETSACGAMSGVVEAIVAVVPSETLKTKLIEFSGPMAKMSMTTTPAAVVGAAMPCVGLHPGNASSYPISGAVDRSMAAAAFTATSATTTTPNAAPTTGPATTSSMSSASLLSKVAFIVRRDGGIIPALYCGISATVMRQALNQGLRFPAQLTFSTWLCAVPALSFRHCDHDDMVDGRHRQQSSSGSGSSSSAGSSPGKVAAAAVPKDGAAAWGGGMVRAIYLPHWTQPNVEQRRRSAIVNGAAGFCAGCFSVLITQPLDVIKTKMQGGRGYSMGSAAEGVRGDSCSGGRRSFRSWARHIFMSCGLRGFYAGLPPRLVRVGGNVALTFSLFPFAQRLVSAA